MVGWAEQGEGLLSLILSCTCKICLKHAGRYPCPSTPSAPLASPPEPAVSARARQAPTAGIKTADEPIVTPTTIKTATARLPQLHHRRRVARRRRASCELSLSNEAKASTLVNQSCRTVMLLNAISHWRRGRS